MCCRTTLIVVYPSVSTSYHHGTCPSTTQCTLTEMIQVLVHPHTSPDSEAVPDSPEQSNTTQTQSHHSHTLCSLALGDAPLHSLGSKGTYNSTPCPPLSRSALSSSQMPGNPSWFFATLDTCVSCGSSSLSLHTGSTSIVPPVLSDISPPLMASSWLLVHTFYAMQCSH